MELQTIKNVMFVNFHLIIWVLVKISSMKYEHIHSSDEADILNPQRKWINICQEQRIDRTSNHGVDGYANNL